MLFAVALITTTDGRLRAVAPDLAHCDLTGDTEQELLPKLRLGIEGELIRLLLAGAGLPDTRDGAPLAAGALPDHARWLNIHINLGHLQALARHQRGR